MQIIETRNGHIAVLQLSGRLTVNDQPGMLRDAVTTALTGGARHVLLELSGVHYIDSTRLGEIISAHVTVCASTPTRGVALPCAHYLIPD